MRITTFNHTKFFGVDTRRGITYSVERGGCGAPECRCSPGHWICMSLGVVDGVLSGITIHFDTKVEMNNFIEAIRNKSYIEEDLLSKGITSEYILLLIEKV
jgi:hypothetical protein